VLYNFSFFQPEDIHDCHSAVTRRPDEVTVNNYQVPFGDEPFEIEMKCREGLGKTLHKRNERTRSITGCGVVLAVRRSKVFCGSFFWFFEIQREVVKFPYRGCIGFLLITHLVPLWFNELFFFFSMTLDNTGTFSRCRKRTQSKEV
jgi:hypothetical protein